MARLVFVGGIYGSGKSTLCGQLTSHFPSIHLKASELANHVPSGSADDGKAVDDVPGNQTRLLSNLDRHRKDAALVVLDGHFCIYDRALNVVDVALEVFEQVRADLLLLVDIEPARAWVRLHSREQVRFDIRRLTELAEREKLHARRVAIRTGVPLEIVPAEVHADTCARILSSHLHDLRKIR